MIIENPHSVFRLEANAITQFDSFSKMKTYQASQSSTPQRKRHPPSAAGVKRSEKLYEHSKQLQDKNRLVELIRVQEEVKQLNSTPKRQAKVSPNAAPVHDRLY